MALHQIGLAKGLKCQRIVCIAREPHPDITALRSAAESSGMTFDAVSGTRNLASHIAAADELVVMTEGLFVEPSRAVPLLAEGGAAVLVQPASGATEKGFERIDASHACAGLMRIPGHLVERMQQLPTDYEVVSTLTRIALQAGIPMRPVPPDAMEGVGWLLVRDEGEAHAVENSWLNGRFFSKRPQSPGPFVAHLAVRAFGSSLLYAGNASGVLGFAVLGLLAIAACLAWLSLAAPAFVLCGLAWVSMAAARMLREAERHALSEMPPAIPRAAALAVLVDIGIALVALAGIERWLDEPLASWLFAPCLLVLAIRAAARNLRGSARQAVEDRFVLAVVLAIASGLNVLLPVVQLLVITYVVICIVAGKRAPDG